MGKKRILVIGLDGATFNIIRPLVNSGKLPNIAKLMNNGAYGSLTSCIPPVTTPAWKCYSTGKNPGKLGVSNFIMVNVFKKEVHSVNSTFFRGKEIWNLLSEHGLRSVVINMPLTYPLKKINGVLISGFDTPHHVAISYPNEVMRELSQNVGVYESGELVRIFLNPDPRKEIRRVIKSRFEAMKYLMETRDWDFFHGTIFLCDEIQHYLWNDKRTIAELWQFIDEKMGELLSQIPDQNNTYIFLMSDHGFRKSKGTIYIDRLLTEFLKYDNSLRSILSYIKEKIDFLTYYVVKILSLCHTPFHKGIAFKLLNKWSYLVRRLLEREIDWDWNRSKILLTTDGISAAIYINKNLFDTEKEIEELRSEIKSKLHKKLPSLLEMYDKSKIYYGDSANNLPDIIILSRDQQFIMKDSRISPSYLFYMPKKVLIRWIGIHEMKGIFIAHGPDIKKMEVLKNLSIVDLAPTILHILGVPIPSDMDGKVVKNLFKTKSDLFKRRIRIHHLKKKEEKVIMYNKEEEKRIRERLKQLGYF